MSSTNCARCSSRIRSQTAIKSQWTQLKALCRANRQPSSPDASQLLKKVLDDLQVCRNEIKKQQAILVSLRTEQSMLEYHIQGYQSLLSPIRKIPVEILRLIFAHFCDDNLIAADQVTVPGLTLAQVCSHWRSLALRSTELWSCISLLIKKPKSSFDWEKPIEFLLRRSGDHDLAVSIKERGSMGDFGVAEKGLKLLATSSQRWHSLSIDVTTDAVDLLADCLMGIKGRLPSLVFLRTDFGCLVEELDIFHEAPSLNSLELTDETDPTLLRLPLTQLRTCTIFRPSDPLTFLQQCTGLLDATVENPLNNYDDEDHDRTIISGLQSLSIRVYGPWEFYFLRMLTLSRLTSFSLSAYDCDWEAESERLFPLDLWTSFIARSSCNLTTLSWDEIPIELTAWISLLQSIPSLETLSLVDEHNEDFGEYLISDDFFNQLRAGPTWTSSGLLPNLRHLSLEASYEVPLQQPALIEAIQSRWIPDTNICDENVCLQSFKLRTSEQKIETRDLEGLEYLASAGLKVLVEDSTGRVLPRAD
ncbi:hypothetical protein C8J56DRAFT_78229 [Mycena floridula]|nr:hypothetical protein C8J56DRAFT_78229 [Mycena floridula]